MDSDRYWREGLVPAPPKPDHEEKKDTAPLVRSKRIKRMIRIQEQNTPPCSLFDTTVDYPSDALPEWFAPLQPIVEDETFTSMHINLGDKTHYSLTIAGDKPATKPAQDDAALLERIRVAIAEERERQDYEVVVGQPRRTHSLPGYDTSHREFVAYMTDVRCTVQHADGLACEWRDYAFLVNGEIRVVLESALTRIMPPREEIAEAILAIVLGSQDKPTE